MLGKRGVTETLRTKSRQKSQEDFQPSFKDSYRHLGLFWGQEIWLFHPTDEMGDKSGHNIPSKRGIEIQPICLQQQLQGSTPYNKDAMA